MHWLSQDKPGGHQKWTFLYTPELKIAYGNALAAISKCDTLIVLVEQEFNLDLENSILIGDKASHIRVGIAAAVGCNILLADTAPVELQDMIYQRITSLSDTLPLLGCGHSTVIAQ